MAWRVPRAARPPVRDSPRAGKPPVQGSPRADKLPVAPEHAGPRNGGRVGRPPAARQARLANLTPQQLRVLMMLSQGLLNKQIAHALGLSEATVKAHVSAILQKLGVDSRTQAVILASRIDTPRAPEPAAIEH